MVAQTNDELPKWITKQKASMLLLDSYFIDLNLVGFFNSRKKKMELDSVLEEIVGRGLINDEQPSLVCLHCLICHDLSSLF